MWISNNKLRHLFSSKFIRNVFVVASGTAGAQAISIGFAPIISRLYGPEAYGQLGTFLALAHMILPLAALSYPIAIVLPKEDTDAKGITFLSLYLSITFSIISLFLMYFLGDWLMALIHSESITSFAILIPIFLLFSSLLQIIQQWLIRKNQFQIPARVNVIKSLAENIIKVSVGWSFAHSAVLIITTTFFIGIHAAMLFLGAIFIGNDKYTRKQQYNGEFLSALAKRYSDFPLYRTPQVFINSVSQALPVLMLAAFFGPVSAGFYALNRRFLAMPSELFSSSVGDVFYPRIAKAFHNGECIFSLIIKATLALALIGLIPFLSILAFGPWIFNIAFGDQWYFAGEYARWLSLMFFFNFINRPVVVAIPVLGLQRGLMVYELFSSGSKLLALYIGFCLLQNEILTIAVYSILGSIAYITLIVWVLCTSRKLKFVS